MHGFAFNLNPELEHYLGIIPCGITQYGVTSLAKLLGKQVDMAEARSRVIDSFQKVFGFSQIKIENEDSNEFK